MKAPFGCMCLTEITLQFLARRRIILPPSIITVGVLVQILTKSLTIIMDRREYFFFIVKTIVKISAPILREITEKIMSYKTGKLLAEKRNTNNQMAQQSCHGQMLLLS
jgi:hypothetical protein